MKKSEDSEVNSLLYVSSNLIIEPHHDPEEYLADIIRKAAAKMNIEDDERKKKLKLMDHEAT